MTPPGKKRKRRVWLWIGGVGICTLPVLYGLALVLMSSWTARPPTIEREPEWVGLPAQPRGDRLYVGPNWRESREGLQVIYLTGTPFEMGYANGVLTQDLMHRQEQSILDLMQQLAPYRFTRFILKFLVVYKNRHLPEFVSESLQREIFGISRGCRDAHPEQGPHYHRILSYHSAQDISYMLMNSPLLRGGCTAFGAWGEATADGHLLSGRNFDWEAAPVFDEDRVLVLCEPDEGIPFISLSWGGMAGCVTALNRAGLSVTVNGAPSELPRKMATPTCLVAREVIQRAKNLEEAEAIIRRHSIFVSALFLVGSREDGRFVVIEKTPEETVLREAVNADHIICSNHYHSPELTNSPINQLYLKADTTADRYDRLAELIAQQGDGLTPEHAVALLRDRRLTGDKFPGNGHRSSLNPLIATHAAVMDLTAGVFWAGAPPHQLGAFVPFAVSTFQSPSTRPSLPRDPFYTSGDYARFLEAREALAQGWRLWREGDYPGALDHAAKAETDNPGFYRNAWLEAQTLWSLKRASEAAEAAQAALDRVPALAKDRERIATLLSEVQAASPSAQRSSRPSTPEAP